MSEITGLTLGGIQWTPQFVLELDPKNCIGCGRCFRVCSRDVFELVERESLGLDDEVDDYDDDDPFGDDDSLSDYDPFADVDDDASTVVAAKGSHYLVQIPEELRGSGGGSSRGTLLLVVLLLLLNLAAAAGLVMG